MCLYTTPWPQILQWDGWVSPAHSSSALSATLATVFISASSHTDNWWPSLSLAPFLLFSPHKSFSCHFSFFSLPSALLALLVCLTLCMLLGVHARFLTSSPPPPSSPAHTDLLPPPPALRLPPSPIVFPSPRPFPSISLLCTIGTRVAPSERPVKRPYKKPQHGEERVMMKFNCSSWCTWGLALYVYVDIWACVCHACVCACSASVRPGHWTGTGLLGGSMSRHCHESYRFLKTHYRFCGGTHLHQHKMEGGRGSLNSKKDGGLGDQ